MGRVLSAGQRHTSYYDNKGRLETASTDDTYLADNVVMQRFGYTDPGALRGDTTIFADGATVRRAYAYNRRGQRTRVSDTLIVAGGSLSGDTGGELRYVYDSLTSRLSSITSLAVTSGSVLDSVGTVYFQYDAGGRDSLRVTDLKGAGDLVTRLTAYNAAGRVAGVTVKSGTTLRYQLSGTTYSPLGELRSATEWKRTMTGSISFKYDSVYGTRRLLTSTSNLSLQSYSYTYDVFGNRLSETHVSSTGEDPCTTGLTYSYGTDSRLLTRPTSTPACSEFRRYITDQAGMRLAEFDTLSGYAGLQSAMTYTAAGQLYYAVTPQQAAGPYDHAWHWYDASGQRIMSHLATGSTLGAAVRPDSAWGTRTYYINDGANVALTLVKGASSWRIHQRYLSTGLDEMAAVRISINGTPTNVATVGDRQNGFIMAVNAAGSEVPEAGFYVKGPFGQQEPGTSAATSGHTGLGFTGAGAPNTSGGYVYLRNRWYDPQTGRFLSQDPIGLAGGVNLYAYAGNNPTAYTDPFGLCVPWCTALAGAALGAVGTVAYNMYKGNDWKQNVVRNTLIGGAVGLAGGAGYATATANPVTTLGLASAGAGSVNRVVSGAGRSIQAAIELGNKAGLTQSQAIQAVTKVLSNTGRATGGVVDAANGGRLILPAQAGMNQPIVHVAADGVAKMGSATVRFMVENGQTVTKVTDIQVR